MNTTDINGDIRIEFFVLDKSNCKKPVYFKLQRRIEQKWKISELSAQRNSANLAFFSQVGMFPGLSLRPQMTTAWFEGKLWTAKVRRIVEQRWRNTTSAQENFARCDLQRRKIAFEESKRECFEKASLFINENVLGFVQKLRIINNITRESCPQVDTACLKIVPHSGWFVTKRNLRLHRVFCRRTCTCDSECLPPLSDRRAVLATEVVPLCQWQRRRVE